MKERLSRSSKKAGLPPGTLVYVGDKAQKKVRITLIDYTEEDLNESKIKRIEDCFTYRDKESVTWINVDGINRPDIIEKLGSHFNLHPLLLEDILNTSQRPKIEDYGDHIFVVLRMFYFDKSRQTINSEQISLVFGENYVISFQEAMGDVFEQVRERIRNAKGRIREKGADYLAYALIDAVVDNYFVVLENTGRKIEEIEEDLVEEPEPRDLTSIHKLKREVVYLKRSVWPLREVISRLERGGSELIEDSTGIYLRDVYDHTIQVIDSIETYRDMLSGMVELYLSSISNKMNQTMKVLTIIATIFIPLTFIAGIYGMNFNPEASPYNMPELNSYWGYVSVWIAMIVVATVMVIYFKKKKWL